MKGSINWKTVIGVALLLCWPTLVIVEGLRAYLAPRNALRFNGDHRTTERQPGGDEPGVREVAPDSPDGTFTTAENTTDVVIINVRDLKAQSASDKANSIASAMVAELQPNGGLNLHPSYSRPTRNSIP